MGFKTCWAALRRIQFQALLTAAICALSGDIAYAQCVPASPVSGDTVTCSGAPPSFTTSGLSVLSVDILAGTSFNGPFSASIMDQLTVLNAGNMQAVTFDTIGNLVFENSGNINNGVIILGDGAHRIANHQGGNINQTFTITGNGADIVINEGTFNPGIRKTGGGSLAIANQAGATINQFIMVTGSSQTIIDNQGTIQSAITLDAGNDLIVNRGNGVINGVANQGAGADVFLMLGGRVNGEILQGDGRDAAAISAGEITQFVRGGAANDNLLWNGGLVGGIDMGTETDRALLANLTQTELRSILIDGGLGAGDAMLWINVAGEQPQRLVNWELIGLTDRSTLTMGGNLTLGDSGTG